MPGLRRTRKRLSGNRLTPFFSPCINQQQGVKCKKSFPDGIFLTASPLTAEPGGQFPLLSFLWTNNGLAVHCGKRLFLLYAGIFFAKKSFREEVHAGKRFQGGQ
jgi:hypothetical protein